MPMKLFEIKTGPQLKVEEEIAQETDLGAQKRIDEASYLRAISRLIARENRPNKPFQFAATRSADQLNARLLQGSVYGGGKS